MTVLKLTHFKPDFCLCGTSESSATYLLISSVKELDGSQSYLSIQIYFNALINRENILLGGQIDIYIDIYLAHPAFHYWMQYWLCLMLLFRTEYTSSGNSGFQPGMKTSLTALG